jgi:hypothetical protein
MRNQLDSVNRHVLSTGPIIQKLSEREIQVMVPWVVSVVPE